MDSPNEKQKSIRVQLREVLFNPRSSQDVNNNNDSATSKSNIETNPRPIQEILQHTTDEPFSSPDEERVSDSSDSEEENAKPSVSKPNGKSTSYTEAAAAWRNRGQAPIERAC